MQKRIATGSYSADQILPTAQFDDAAPDVPRRESYYLGRLSIHILHPKFISEVLLKTKQQTNST
eukprot:1291200-Amphidinium_carterae.1